MTISVHTPLHKVPSGHTRNCQRERQKQYNKRMPSEQAAFLKGKGAEENRLKGEKIKSITELETARVNYNATFQYADNFVETGLNNITNLEGIERGIDSKSLDGTSEAEIKNNVIDATTNRTNLEKASVYQNLKTYQQDLYNLWNHESTSIAAIIQLKEEQKGVMLNEVEKHCPGNVISPLPSGICEAERDNAKKRNKQRKDEKDQLDEEINELRKAQANAESSKSKAQSEINDISSKLSDLLANAEVEEDNIAKAIEELNENIQHQQTLLASLSFEDEEEEEDEGGDELPGLEEDEEEGWKDESHLHEEL